MANCTNVRPTSPVGINILKLLPTTPDNTGQESKIPIITNATTTSVATSVIVNPIKLCNNSNKHSVISNKLNELPYFECVQSNVVVSSNTKPLATTIQKTPKDYIAIPTTNQSVPNIPSTSNLRQEMSFFESTDIDTKVIEKNSSQLTHQQIVVLQC